MWKEFKISRTLQNVIRYPWAFNFVIRQANRSKYLHKFLIDALADIDKKRTVLWKPGFYIRMLFK
jgi:menaquinone-9 beta-reductase